MDFVASKVGMSVCALMVSSILVSVLEGSQTAYMESELDGIAREMADDLSSVLLGGVRSRTVDQVPWLATGEAVDVAVSTDSLLLRCGSAATCVTLAHSVHLWRWNGSRLDLSEVGTLDSMTPPLEASSGDLLETSVENIEVDDSDVLMVFVRVIGRVDGQNLSATSLTASASTSMSSVVL
jgi:hypothetical protein